MDPWPRARGKSGSGIVQHAEPDDFVIATGDTRTVRGFLQETFGLVGLEWEDFVVTEDRYRRPAEVPALLGDASKARRLLGWEPKVRFSDLCRMMLEADLGARDVSWERARQLASALRPAVKK